VRKPGPEFETGVRAKDDRAFVCPACICSDSSFMLSLPRTLPMARAY